MAYIHLTFVSLQILLEREQQPFNYIGYNICFVRLNLYFVNFFRRDLYF